MAAGRSTDEPFWDNYSGYSNHRSGCVVNCTAHSLTEVDARTHAHTHLLYLDPESPPLLTHKEDGSPRSCWNSLTVAWSLLLSAWSRYQRFHQDGKICISWIILTLGPFNFRQQYFIPPISAWSGCRTWRCQRTRLPPPLTPGWIQIIQGDNNELWPQLWAACVCMHLIKAPMQAAAWR